MLQTIRDRLTGWVAVFVLAVIGIALVISFGNMNTDAVPVNVVAKVNGEEIPKAQFRQVYQQQLLRQQQAFKGELPAALRQQLQRNVLESMIRNRVVAQYVKEQGYQVSDKDVADAIRRIEVFQVGGAFSQQAYVATLASQGLTPEVFEEQQRQAMKIAQFQGGIVGSAFLTPAEYRQFIRLQQEKRTVSMVRFEPSKFLDRVQVSESEISQYYDANQKSFERPESVAIDYVELNLDDIAGEVTVSDASVHDYYEANLDRFTTPEERRARHILIAVDDDTDDAQAARLAGNIYQQLSDGADFAALAKKYSDDPGSAPDGGELGWSGRGVYVTEFEDALYALQKGEISKPVKTRFGYHIIQLEDVREGARRSFSEVQKQLREELQRQQSEDRFYELAERMDDLALENPGSLDPVAEQLGLEVRHADSITRSGGEPFGFQQALIDAAFDPAVLEDGENSSVVELDDGHAVVLRVAEHHPPEVRPLEEVRDQIAADLRLQKAAELARETGQAFLQKARAGASMKQLATEFGVELQEDQVITRATDQLSPDLVAAIFRTRLPSADNAVVDGLEMGDGGYAVFVLQRVEPGKPEALARELRDQQKARMAEQTGNSSLAAIVQDLVAGATITISEDAFQDPGSQ